MSDEDFFVAEVLDKKVLSRISQDEGYAVYKLKKRGTDTNHVLSEIFKKHNLRLKALGLKDANALTEQYVCSMNKNKSVDSISSRKYSLERLGFVKKPLTKKDMVGNHFKIKIHDSFFSKISEFKEDDKVLNFYGYQRFGSKRAVSHLIGKAILQNDFEEAVNLLLSFTSKYDLPENTEIREMLQDKTYYAKLVDKIPPQMDLEKIVLSEMISNDDPTRAIRAVPLTIRRLFVQAYQAFIFNQVLSGSFEDGEDLY
ncbi:MAG: tRNA pseudouridine(13) synthase TruD, partial [Nitrosopumilaceae archaeon]